LDLRPRRTTAEMGRRSRESRECSRNNTHTHAREAIYFCATLKSLQGDEITSALLMPGRRLDILSPVTHAQTTNTDVVTTSANFFTIAGFIHAFIHRASLLRLFENRSDNLFPLGALSLRG